MDAAEGNLPTFEPTGEVRPPKRGEWFLSMPKDALFRYDYEDAIVTDRIIYRRVTRPAAGDEPLLGLATTAELLAELQARAETNGYANYRTVDGGSIAPAATAEPKRCGHPGCTETAPHPDCSSCAPTSPAKGEVEVLRARVAELERVVEAARDTARRAAYVMANAINFPGADPRMDKLLLKAMRDAVAALRALDGGSR